MLAFAFAFVAGFVNTAAVLHAPSAGQLQLSERSPLTARRSQNSVMGASLSGRTWEDIVKDGFNRAATPAEFCQQIEREKFNERGDVAHILYSPRSNGCSFSDEAFAELLRRGYTGERPRSSESMSWDVRTDPIALALVLWCVAF